MAKTNHSIQAWIVLCNGQVDQICGSEHDAKREANDLRKMDCGRIKIKSFATWQEAEAYEDHLRGY